MPPVAPTATPLTVPLPERATATNLRTAEVHELKLVGDRLVFDLRSSCVNMIAITSVRVGGVELLSPEHPMPFDPVTVVPVRTDFVASPVDVEAQAAELIANVKLFERIIIVAFLRNRAYALEDADPATSRIVHGLAAQVARGDHFHGRRPEPARRVAAPRPTTPPGIPAELVAIRQAAGLSQQAISRRLGVSRSLVTHAETGRHVPSGEVLAAWRAIPPRKA